jgi:hypothetical protein
MTDGSDNEPQDAHEALELFGAVVRHGAYGRTTAFLLPADADPAARRDRALAQVEATADGQDRAVVDQGIKAMVERGNPFSINDLRPLLPVVRKSIVGPRFLAAAKRGEIVRVGYVPSSEPSDHCRPVALWRPA